MGKGMVVVGGLFGKGGEGGMAEREICWKKKGQGIEIEIETVRGKGKEWALLLGVPVGSLRVGGKNMKSNSLGQECQGKGWTAGVGS